MDTGVKSPLDSQQAALLLGDKCRVKDDGKHTKLQLHCIKCIPKCPGETQVQTLPSSMEKKKKILIFSHTCSGCLPRVWKQFLHGFPDLLDFLCSHICTLNPRALSEVFGVWSALTGREASSQRLQHMQSRSIWTQISSFMCLRWGYIYLHFSIGL